DTIGLTVPAPSAWSSALRLRAPEASPCPASNAARASRLFFPPFPSISPDEKLARSRRICISSSAGPTDRTAGAERLAAIEVDAPRRIAALATKHDRVLSVNVMAPPGATKSLLLAIMLRTTQRKVIRPRSDASVQHRSRQPERWKEILDKKRRTGERLLPSFLGCDPVCDFVILSLRHDAPRHHLAGFAIGTSCNHPVRFCRGYTRQAQQLLFCGR